MITALRERNAFVLAEAMVFYSMQNPERFSIWSSYDIDLSPEDMVCAMERRGLTVCELSDEHAAVLLERGENPETVGYAFKAFADAHNVAFPQGHLWLNVRLCAKEVDSVSILKDWITLFSVVGIKNAVLHCDGRSFDANTSHEEILSANAERLKELAPYAEQRGVRICLENLGGHFACIDDLLQVIRLVGSPALGICLDTGHLNIHDKNTTQLQFIRKAGALLHALHIADNEGVHDQHMMPFGRGNVNWKSVMQGLAEIGYADLFNYEIPGERLAPMAVRDAKAEYLKKVTASLYALTAQEEDAK